MPRKAQQDRSEQTRGRILDAALDLFSNQGFDAVALRDVARAAGVNHAMIRYYFDTKDALWRESVTQMFRRQKAELNLQERPEQPTIREQFAAFVRDYVRYCARYPEHARLMVREATLGSDRLEWLSQSFVRENHEQLTPMIRALIAEGSLPDIDPGLAIYLMWAMAQAPYLMATEMRYTYGTDAMSDRAVDAHAEAVVRLLLRDPAG